MIIIEQEFELDAVKDHKNLIGYFREAVSGMIGSNRIPVRFVVSRSDNRRYFCELGLLSEIDESVDMNSHSIFEFVKRKHENTDEFNVVLLIPTGIGTEIGGHAGDAAPVARLLASVCDTLITHPNAVNASDINEIPENGMYVEGSIICRLMMGAIGLQPVRSNKVLVVIDRHHDETFVNAAINSVNGARASWGFTCPRVVQLDPPIRMKSVYTSSGRASGRVDGIKNLIDVLDKYRDEYDAVAFSSVISIPLDYHMDYYTSEGKMVNPWGGVEAILTHTVSLLYDFPSAHAPMFESEMTLNIDPGIVDPRMAAEVVSLSFMQCILKGLHRSPRIIKDRTAMRSEGVFTAEDISCLVIPDGCIGLPTLAALEQGIPVIAVKENRNKMRNDLTVLPWASGQFFIVENYWEAAGVLSAIKSGVAPESVRRPLRSVEITTENFRITSDEQKNDIAVEKINNKKCFL